MTLIETIFNKLVAAIYKDSGVQIYIEYKFAGNYISVVKAEHELSKKYTVLGYIPSYNKTELLERVLFGYSYHQYSSMSLFDILKLFQYYSTKDKNEIGSVELTEVELALSDSMLCKKLSGIRKCDSIEELALEMDLIGI